MPSRGDARARRRPGVLLVVVALAVASAALLSPRPARAAAKAVEGVINLNTAPPELLALLPGVGPSKARAIIDYRTRRPFRTVDELVRVRGIGRRMVRAIRVNLAVAGPSTGRTTKTSRDPGVQTPPPAAATPPRGAVPARRPLPPTTRAVAHSTDPSPPRSRANHCAPPA